MAQIILCKHCRCGGEISSNSGDIKFVFQGIVFLLARPVNRTEKPPRYAEYEAYASTDSV